MHNHQKCFPPPSRKRLSTAIWDVFPHTFHGFGQINPRINYVIHQSSPILKKLPARLRYFRHRDVAKSLMHLGASFIRQGKGSHEVWRSKLGKNIIVPNHPGGLPTGTITNIMRQAGFRGSIDDFLQLS